MRICLITDRRRLAAAMGAHREEESGLLERQVDAAAKAGVDLVQVREADLEARPLSALVERLVDRCRGTRARVVVNERIDVAVTAGADGVHLKERSVSCAAARLLAPAGFLVGRSVHRPGSVAELAGADYLIAGTVMATPSKPGTDLLGWEGLLRVSQAADGLPVLAVGGMSAPSIPLLASHGAAGLASIGAFIPFGGEDLVHFVQKRVTEMRFAFDSLSAVS